MSYYNNWAGLIDDDMIVDVEISKDRKKTVSADIVTNTTNSIVFDVSHKTPEYYSSGGFKWQKVGRRILVPTKDSIKISDASKDIEENYLKLLTGTPVELKAIIHCAYKKFVAQIPSDGSSFDDAIVLKNVLIPAEIKVTIGKHNNICPMKMLEECTRTIIDIRKSNLINSAERPAFPIVEYIGIWINYDVNLGLYMVKPQIRMSPTIMTINRYNSLGELTMSRHEGITI